MVASMMASCSGRSRLSDTTSLHATHSVLHSSCQRVGNRLPTARLYATRVTDGIEAGRRRLAVLVSAMSGDSKDSETGAAGMTREQAMDVLGLARDASFDRALSAKNKLAARQQDPQKLMEIDAAYDVLLMDNMRKRLSGEADVAKSVRFADVRRARPKKQASAPTLPGGLRVARPANQTLTTQSAVFGLLAIWTLVQALTAPPSNGLQDTGVPSLQLAAAIAASVYFLRENKRLGLGKAAAVTGGGFVLGSIVGTLLQQWLRVDIVPLGGFSSPGALVGEFAILSLWFSSTFVS